MEIQLLVVLAVFLLITIPVQAQCGLSLLDCIHESSAETDPRNAPGRRDLGIGPSFDAPLAATFGETNTATPATESLLSDSSAIPVFICVVGARSPDSVSTELFRSPSNFHAEPMSDAEQAGGDARAPSIAKVRPTKPVEFNQAVYYKNKLELGLDFGVLPINIPFVFDVFLGDAYHMTPLHYTLMPIIGSLRWHVDDVGGPSILRGNWDLQASLAVTLIPRGPESRYFAFILGFRRNFVPRHGKFAPYFDGRVGLGEIDAQEPLGAVWAQGQDFTFTLNMGSGFRYNISPSRSISFGINWMHISNLYLSQPKYPDYGINVYGPMIGVDIRLGKHHPDAAQ